MLPACLAIWNGVAGCGEYWEGLGYKKLTSSIMKGYTMAWRHLRNGGDDSNEGGDHKNDCWSNRWKSCNNAVMNDKILNL